MSISVAQINSAANGDTWGVLVTRLNQIINAVSTQVLTSAANTSGGVTTGNVFVGGVLSATKIAAGTLLGGNVATPADLAVGSNTQIQQGFFLYVGNSSVNNFINSTAAVLNNVSIANLTVLNFSLSSQVTLGNTLLKYVSSVTTGTARQVVDTFDPTVYRSAEYVITVKDNNANSAYASKLLVIHSTNTVFSTEWAQMTTNAALGVFDVTINSTAVALGFTPVSTNTSFKALRFSVGV